MALILKLNTDSFALATIDLSAIFVVTSSFRARDVVIFIGGTYVAMYS